MNEAAAINLVKGTFENPYSRERFLTFTKNLFKGFDEGKAFHARGYVKDKFKKTAGVVKTYERLGTYTAPDSNRVDILAVFLEKDSSLDRARTTQRNFVADYLKQRDAKEAALVAFVPPKVEEWRLSLVKMDYHLGKTKAGKIKAITELTPARRFSYLVGKDESTHTVQKQLLPILLDDGQSPKLTDLETAFNVEVVTKDFFEKYRILFLNTKEVLDKIVAKDAKIKSDFTKKDIDSVDFTKKLLGQIVFLYFLQKKGWFGVERNKDWGTGPKDFLRRLFEKGHGDYKNFFDNILEPLFYEALAIERPNDYYSRFDCKIPFLNGGLFDPLGNYDWVHTKILLPDNLFSNTKKTKEGDIGDGILDVFDRYNFTVKEDEPLEREVAVDPEMLGKVFENLLEVKDRKSKGTYYTPREIVHYMCQESLVNYLTTETDGRVKREDIETLIRLGETAVEHDSRVVSHGEETGSYKFKLPKKIRKNASSIDESLEKIKVCDPAVGSGAFLVGMMNEVIRTRNALTPYIGKDGERTPYNFKSHSIQSCLYGVDIDPGAVDICKLRLWLSLVVDEEDRRSIQPLPNLDYKIMQGNSLLEEYEGVKLFEPEKESEQQHFLELVSESEKITKKLQELKKQFFKAAHKSGKDSIKKEIENLTWDLIEASIKEQKRPSLLPQIEHFKKANIRPFFLWKLNFSEVFEKNGGFDVVIANPPYIRQEGIKYKESLKEEYEIFNAVADLYTYFYERGISLLCNHGVLAFITSNKFTRARYGINLRQFLKSYVTIKNIVNFGDKHIFEAITNTLVLVATKSKPSNNIFGYSDSIENPFKIKFPQSDLNDTEWTIDKPEVIKIKKSIEMQGLPLKEWGIKIDRGVVTGYNDAFLLDKSTSRKIIGTNSKYKDIIKPIIRGRDISRWTYLSGTQYLITTFPSLNIDIDFYPEVKKHLLNFGKDRLEQSGKTLKNGKKARKKTSNKWFETQDQIAYYPDFKKEKIIWIELTNKSKFTYSDKEDYLLAGAFLMVGEPLKYLLAFLNSKLCYFYFSLVCNSSGMATIQWKKFALEKVPIMKLSEKRQKPFIQVVDKILEITKSDDYSDNQEKRSQVKSYETQIDQMIYKLYGLPPEEIEIVEKS